jgi:hypothetical protein
VKERVYTNDAMQVNRRVEVITTSNLVEELQDRPPASPLNEELGADKKQK